MSEKPAYPTKATDLYRRRSSSARTGEPPTSPITSGLPDRMLRGEPGAYLLERLCRGTSHKCEQCPAHIADSEARKLCRFCLKKGALQSPDEPLVFGVPAAPVRQVGEAK